MTATTQKTQIDLDRFHCINKLLETMIKLGLLTHTTAPFPGTKQGFIIRHGDKLDKSHTDSITTTQGDFHGKPTV